MATPSTEDRVVVAIGDGALSGVGGRWQENITRIFYDQNGTDRGEDVYGSTAGQCFQSDVAPIHSARITERSSINLACNGASEHNILRTSSDGRPQYGMAPQAEQLAHIAAEKKVDMIVMSTGILPDSQFIKNCMDGYLAGEPGHSKWDCSPQKQSEILMYRQYWKFDEAVKDVRAVMSEAGYNDSDYKLVIQSHTAPLPRASEMRYISEDDRIYGSCALSNVDLNWLRDWHYPYIAKEFQKVARSNNAGFLDVTDAFRGHETCSKNARLTNYAGETGAHAEWSRNARTLRWAPDTDGAFEEALQPNAYGQQALGACINELFFDMWLTLGTSWKCVPSVPNWRPGEMSIYHSP
ncbi:hypothetical protein [Streptomyces sp. NPDC007904]|uniref:hypothetical protein n=1 Tax=Streptomyces sp. NPDC007904 TaxID=3364787 RepID=UPI0036E24733